MQSTADLVLLKNSMSMRMMASSEVDRNTVMILTTRSLSLSLIYIFKQTLREVV